MASFKVRLRDLREQNKMSQTDLANLLNVSKQTISQYERGIRKPKIDDLLEISDIFNVSTDYLLGSDNYTPRYVNPCELRLLDAYRRAAPGIQLAVEKLLDMNHKTSEETELLNNIK